MTRAALVLVALLGACLPEPDLGEPLAGGCVAADSDPENDVSFAHDVRPLFDRGMGEAGCSCHNSPTGIGAMLGGLELSSLARLRRGGFTTGAQIVVPGDPCRSYLVQKVSLSPPWGSRMPLNGPPYLTDEEIQLISDWIFEGARDN